MSVANAGRQLLSLAHESHFRALEDAIRHEHAHATNHEQHLRQETQDERIQRFKMLSGAGMQKSLVHSGYKPSPTDSLSAEMSRQQEVGRALRQAHLTRAQSRGPAGVLSGMHFTASAGEVFVKGGIRTQPRRAGEVRDPILATGPLEVSYGYDSSHNRSLKAHTRREEERRNIITGTGHMQTHGFDKFRRPQFGAGQLRKRSTLNLFGQ